jgi:hypothetical protein
MKILFAALLAAACALAADAALAQGKHFHAAQRNFEDVASKATTLASDLDSPAEKNVCNFFTATSLLYAVRSHALAQLADVASRTTLPEERAYAASKLAETRAYAVQHTAMDIRAVENLAVSTKNARVRALGMRLASELRVFENNAANVRAM